MTADRRFAKDVARELDLRTRRRRLLLLAAGALLVVLAILYVRCGSGFGTGGSGNGSGTGSGGVVTPDAGPRHCAIRVSASGIAVDGKPATRNEAVAICSKTGVAEVVVTGDARERDWTELEAALKARKIEIIRHM